MRRSTISLFVALLACGPPKSGDETQGEGGTSTTTSGTATIGHSSTPTGGPADASGDAGPGDDGSASTALPGPTTSTTTPPDSTGTTAPVTTGFTTAVTTGIDDDSVPIFPEETDVAFIVPSIDVPPGDCNPWQEDCPDGQKCMPSAAPGSPSWDTLVCVPIVVDPAPLGAPCVVLDHPTSGLDSCKKHAMCWGVDETLQGQCIALCSGDGDAHFCDEPGQTCVMANNDILPICLPQCDPLIVDCPGGQVCIPAVGAFVCAPDASGPGGGLFSACTGGNTCDPGLVCADAELSAQCGGPSDECCLAMCDLGQPDCPNGQACTLWSQDSADIGVCVDA